VKDTGIGMTEDQTKEVFNRFAKLENERKKLYRGAGLGLSICKHIIQLLGGEIWVESQINIGSSFFFSLPYDVVLKSKNKKTTQFFSDKHIDFTGKTLLIAEDEDSNFRLLQMILEKSNINIIRAFNGDEAVQMFQKQTVDLILTDIKMPISDGITAVKKIREMNSEIPVIAQTAYAMEIDKKTCIEAGCNAYITKPVDKKKLFDLLLQFLEK